MSDKMRIDFEQYAMKCGYAIDRVGHGYVSYTVQRMWMAWQQATLANQSAQDHQIYLKLAAKKILEAREILTSEKGDDHWRQDYAAELLLAAEFHLSNITSQKASLPEGWKIVQ